MNPLVEKLLTQRGIEDFDKFLNPVLSDLNRPEELPGITAAVEVILAMVAARRQIVVFGDYDCDGVCATAIVMRVLKAIGPEVPISSFVPKRLTEGYGMSDASVARMLVEHPDVSMVITVDNGINSVSQVAKLKSLGIAVVITDHHLPGEELPAADAIVNPRVAAPPALENLCGAAVAYLLSNQLVNVAHERGISDVRGLGGIMLILAGLATVTDIMPLLGFNRVLVHVALEKFRAWAPIGLRALYDRAAKSGIEQLTTKDFSFLLGPRINAAGRIASSEEALELLTTDDREIAREAARLIDLHNAERKTIEAGMTEEAISKLVDGAAAQVIDLPKGHPGVAGIVAARLLERLGNAVPVCVLAGGHGSARSPNGINIRDAFVACDAVLERYGGHAAAGGFSVRSGKVDEFRRMLCEYCAALPKSENHAPFGEVELWVGPNDLSVDFAEQLALLEPFGEGNPEPIFGFHSVMISEPRLLGNDGRHLCVQVGGLKAIWWGRGDLVEELRTHSNLPYEAKFNLVLSDYGERHVEIRLLDLHPINCQ